MDKTCILHIITCIIVFVSNSSAQVPSPSIQTYDSYLALDKYSADIKQFPVNFKYGAAGSAYQIEGAWNIDGE